MRDESLLAAAGDEDRQEGGVNFGLILSAGEGEGEGEGGLGLAPVPGTEANSLLVPSVVQLLLNTESGCSPRATTPTKCPDGRVSHRRTAIARWTHRSLMIEWILPNVQ